MGADCIEPDLVSTSDGVLIARHENEISQTTDVAVRPEFADRRRTTVVDGVERTGWFTEDFTLAEMRTLRAVERLPEIRQGNTAFDGRFDVPTLSEILDLRARVSRQLRREVGVYIETKHPTHFAGLGLGLEEPLARALRMRGLDHAAAPVFLQSFELTSLHILALEHAVQVPLVFLVGEQMPYDLMVAGDPRSARDLITRAGLERISPHLVGIGPAKHQVIAPSTDGMPARPTSLVRDAHATGLVVHPYTFRAENAFLPVELRRGSDPGSIGVLTEEIAGHLDLGVDGFFTDQPDIGVRTRDAFLARQRRS